MKKYKKMGGDIQNMLPKVIIYNTISLDGSLNFFNYDSKHYYEIASKLNVDAVLMDNNTLLKEINSETGELYNGKIWDMK